MVVVTRNFFPGHCAAAAAAAAAGGGAAGGGRGQGQGCDNISHLFQFSIVLLRWWQMYLSVCVAWHNIVGVNRWMVS